VELTLKFERSVKHSHLFKADDGSNAYIKRDQFEGQELPKTLIVLDQDEYDRLRDTQRGE
jgi:hypothetical protein